MKKFTLIIASLMAILCASAHDQKAADKKVRKPSHSNQPFALAHSPQMHNTTNTITIFSEDFGGGIPGTWSIVDNNGSGEVWAFAFGPQGPSNQNGDTLLSATAANGFAMIDDDNYGSGTPPTNTDLITPDINCSSIAVVHISFTDFFEQFQNPAATLSISNDGGLSWAPIYIDSTTVPNPNYVDIDVTDSAAGHPNVRFKFNYQGNWDFWWQVDDIAVYEPSNFDGAAVAVVTAPTACQLTTTEPVLIAIRNNGVSPISNFPASFNVNGGPTTTENISATINAGDTLNYLFTGTADLSAVGPHTINAWVAVPSDGNTSNDSTSFSTVNLTPIAINISSSLLMGFETTDDLTGWTVIDANGDGYSWGLADNSVLAPHTGAYCLLTASGTTTMDDWLFSRCIDLQSGTNYFLEFWMHLYSDVGNIKAYIGASNHIPSMTQVIANVPGVIGNWIDNISNFTVPTTGTYYVGFRSNETGSFPGITRIDDINLSIVAGVNEIKGTEKWFDVYPNPAVDNLTIQLNRPFDNAAVEIINALGSVVKSFNTEVNTKTIDITNLESGIYTIKVKFDGREANKRFAINK